MHWPLSQIAGVQGSTLQFAPSGSVFPATQWPFPSQLSEPLQRLPSEQPVPAGRLLTAWQVPSDAQVPVWHAFPIEHAAPTSTAPPTH
jgi:hypothetical protein